MHLLIGQKSVLANIHLVDCYDLLANKMTVTQIAVANVYLLCHINLVLNISEVLARDIPAISL